MATSEDINLAIDSQRMERLGVQLLACEHGRRASGSSARSGPACVAAARRYSVLVAMRRPMTPLLVRHGSVDLDLRIAKR